MSIYGIIKNIDGKDWYNNCLSNHEKIDYEKSLFENIIKIMGN